MVTHSTLTSEVCGLNPGLKICLFCNEAAYITDDLISKLFCRYIPVSKFQF